MSSADFANRAQSVFSLVDREVWIVTAMAGNRRGGMVATWVRQTSLDEQAPALVVGIDRNHYTGELVSESGRFAAHLIRSDQIDLVWRFGMGSSGRNRDKLEGLELAEDEIGIPVLADCVAWLGCEIYETNSTGDRTYYWADVVAAGQVSAGPPLGEQEVLRRAGPERLEQLKAAKMADVATLGPLREAYRKGLR